MALFLKIRRAKVLNIFKNEEQLASEKVLYSNKVHEEDHTAKTKERSNSLIRGVMVHLPQAFIEATGSSSLERIEEGRNVAETAPLQPATFALICRMAISESERTREKAAGSNGILKTADWRLHCQWLALVHLCLSYFRDANTCWLQSAVWKRAKLNRSYWWLNWTDSTPVLIECCTFTQRCWSNTLSSNKNILAVLTSVAWYHLKSAPLLLHSFGGQSRSSSDVPQCCVCVWQRCVFCLRLRLLFGSLLFNCTLMLLEASRETSCQPVSHVMD